MPAAIVNSNNVIFANGGGSGNPVYYVHTANVEYDKVRDVIAKSGMVVPFYSVMGGVYYFNIDTVSVAGTKRGYAFVNDSISSQQKCFIWESGVSGEVSYATGVDMATSYYQVPQVSSQTTSTSGIYFYGNTAVAAKYVYLYSNDEQDQPFELSLPPRSETDIFYDSDVVGSYTERDTKFKFGIKESTTTAADWLDYNTIVFPENEANGNEVHYSTVLRYKNESYSPKTVYLACSTTDNGSLPSDAMYVIGDDSVKTRSYPL